MIVINIEVGEWIATAIFIMNGYSIDLILHIRKIGKVKLYQCSILTKRGHTVLIGLKFLINFGSQNVCMEEHLEQ